MRVPGHLVTILVMSAKVLDTGLGTVRPEPQEWIVEILEHVIETVEKVLAGMVDTATKDGTMTTGAPPTGARDANMVIDSMIENVITGITGFRQMLTLAAITRQELCKMLFKERSRIPRPKEMLVDATRETIRGPHPCNGEGGGGPQQ